MDMRTVTLENGWTGIPSGRPARADSTGPSAFAAQLDRAAKAAEQAQASGDAELKAAYDRLSGAAKETLGSLKAGEGISEDQWYALRKEMRDQGLITPYEFTCSDPHMVVVGYTGENGEAVSYFPDSARIPPGMEGADFLVGGIGTCRIGGEVYGRFWALEGWSGDPAKFLEMWLEAFTGWRDDLDQALRPNGQRYDTSHLTNHIEAKKKVNDLAYALAEYC